MPLPALTAHHCRRPAPPLPQIVTAAQTCIIALMLSWLYSDMSKSYAGIQDETG